MTANLYSTRELLVMEKASYQIFEFARKRESCSDHTLTLMCQSASYVLHVVARLDEITNIDSVWQWEDRSKVFGQLKESLREWIARSDVIGGSMFGGSVLQYGSKQTARKNRGKRELQVHQQY